MPKARIAVIGAGWWATYAHMPALQAHPDAELVAIADVDAGKLAKAADYYDIASTYTDFREMLEVEDLDGVIVAVWHAGHYEVAGVCLEQGLHMVLEKPMVLHAPH
ncbi:MAG: Gfo/Idh/MocA family oxidoreductase, partial [Gammaproteobacteria bacterium]|nr:Gfo/Idh/MocA family oxidoreductase [Gammaproteobacteria bacterium]